MRCGRPEVDGGVYPPVGQFSGCPIHVGPAWPQHLGAGVDDIMRRDPAEADEFFVALGEFAPFARHWGAKHAMSFTIRMPESRHIAR